MKDLVTPMTLVMIAKCIGGAISSNPIVRGISMLQ
jgi:hypothetical protein